MGFRDDNLAARSQVEALKEEVRELREKNAELEARPPKTTSKEPTGRNAAAPLLIAIIVIVGAALLAGTGAVLTRDSTVPIGLTLLAMVLLGFVPPLALLRNLIFVPAQHVVVISGRQNRTLDGKQVGYCIVTSGATLPIPLIEKVVTLRDLGAVTAHGLGWRAGGLAASAREVVIPLSTHSDQRARRRTDRTACDAHVLAGAANPDNDADDGWSGMGVHHGESFTPNERLAATRA